MQPLPVFPTIRLSAISGVGPPLTLTECLISIPPRLFTGEQTIQKTSVDLRLGEGQEADRAILPAITGMALSEFLVLAQIVHVMYRSASIHFRWTRRRVC